MKPARLFVVACAVVLGVDDGRIRPGTTFDTTCPSAAPWVMAAGRRLIAEHRQPGVEIPESLGGHLLRQYRPD